MHVTFVMEQTVKKFLAECNGLKLFCAMNKACGLTLAGCITPMQ